MNPVHGPECECIDCVEDVRFVGEPIVPPKLVRRTVSDIFRKPGYVSVVYFIQAGDTPFVKIGATNREVTWRMSILQVGNHETLKILLVLLSDHKTGESEVCFHHRFKPYRHRGEWFRLEGELAKFIEERAQNGFSIRSPTDMNGHTDGI